MEVKRSALVLIITVEAGQFLGLHQYMSTGLDSAGASGTRVCFLTYFHTCNKEVRTLEVDLITLSDLLVNDVYYEFYWRVDASRRWPLISKVQQRPNGYMCVYISHLSHLRALRRVLCAVQWVLISYLLYALFMPSNVLCECCFKDSWC